MHYLRLMGRCLDGAERDCGVKFHAVPEGQWKALCGAQPGKRSAGWSSHVGTEATCPRCVRKLAIITSATKTILTRNPWIKERDDNDLTQEERADETGPQLTPEETNVVPKTQT